MIMGKEDYERIIGKLRERAEKAEAELAESKKKLKEEEKFTNKYIRSLHKMQAERDRLLAIMETIANNHDCDPRAEAREALTPSPRSALRTENSS